MDVNLVLFKKGGERKTFVLPAKRVIIGRAKDCDFWLPVLSVSRRHCEISVENSTVLIHDLGSRNGTFVNGMRIVNANLRPGDFIRIGPILFGVQIDGQPTTLMPPDFVMLEESTSEERPGEGSTIIQPPSDKTQTGVRDVAEDIMSWLDERDQKNGKSENGHKP
jgi:pSer/pThr/pTyr-binding forkhead associated (FHA) protein